MNDIAHIESFLQGTQTPGDACVFEARLILQPQLRADLLWQQKTYHLVQIYGRKKLRQELEAIHHKLFNEPQHENFRNKILRLFSQL